MDFATRFVLNLKSYFDAIPLNVWMDFERNLLPSRKWDENSILRTSIIRDGFDKKNSLDAANDNPVYKLEVRTEDYGGGAEETLTGADLALVLRLEVNRTLVTSRVVLVQLKRAFYKNGSTTFPALHHNSGAKYFGRDYHQAQKMMFFSVVPVYWFAMSSGVLQDESSLGVYSQQSNLWISSLLPSQSASAEPMAQGGHGSPLDPLFGVLPFASLSVDDIEEYYEFLEHDWPPFHRFRRPLGQRAPNELKRNLDYARENLPYQLFSMLRNRLQQYAFDNAGMPNRMGLFVCNAEDVYALSHSGKCGFADVYPKSIPFTQFMLQKLIGERFGDSNEALISAILGHDVKRYFRNRVQQLADGHDFRVPDAIGETVPVRYSIVVSLQLRTAVEQE